MYTFVLCVHVEASVAKFLRLNLFSIFSPGFLYPS